MKFECDSCHASYMIADEKVGKRGVKVKCKRCSHVIIVRPEKAAATASGASPADAGAGPAEQDQGDPSLVAVGDEPAVDDQAERHAADPGILSDEDRANDTVTMSAQEREALLAMERATDQKDSGGASMHEGDGPTVATSPPDDVPAPSLDADQGSPWSSDGGEGREAEPPSALGLDAPTAVGAVPGWKMEAQSGADTELGASPPGSTPDATVPGGAPSIAGAAPDLLSEPAADVSPLLTNDAMSSAKASFGLDLADDAPSAAMGNPDSDLDVPAPPAHGVDLLDAQIAGAFSDMFGALPDPDTTPVPPPPMFDDADNRGPTRVLDLAKVDALRAATVPSVLSDEDDALDRLRTDFGGPTDSGDGLDPFTDEGPRAPVSKRAVTVRPVAPDDSGGWHVAIDDEDVGPLRLSQLVEHIEDGRAEPDALVWRTGMSDWTPANETPDVVALMKSRPMPKIPTPGFENAGFDVGDPIDDRRSSSSAQNDPFSAVADASDPNWRPHGLTEVYQAANLAEVAAGARGGGNLLTPAITRDEPPDESDAGWQPSAASALASLVADEIKRIDAGPAVVDEPSYPPLSDDLGMGMSSKEVSGASLGSPLLGMTDIPDAAPAVRYPVMGVQSATLPPVESFPPMPSTMGYPPAMAPRSPVIYAVGGALALVLVIIAAALVKMAFLGPGAPVAVVDPRVQQPVATAAATADVPAKPPETDPATAGGDVRAPDPEPSSGKPEEQPKPDDGKGDVVASAAGNDTKAKDPPEEKPSAPKGDAKPRMTRDERPVATKEPKPSKPDPKPEKPVQTASATPASKPVADTPKPKATPKGCDPVLDFDCDEKKASGGGASSKKATLSKADVFEVVKKNISKINACGSKNKVKGTIKVEWEILKSGRTSSVRVIDPAYAGTPVGRCMVTEIQRWVFPAYTGAAPPPIKFPFKLG